MRRPIDPIVLATAMLLSGQHAKRLAAKPLTPEQLARRAQHAERKAWNDAVDAKKLAKKGRK